MDARGLFDEVGVDEEEVESGLAERLLDADAGEAGGLGGAVGRRRDSTRSRRGGSRTRAPRCRGALAEVALMGGDGGADLGADAFVGAEQRHVAVGGGAGDDLDHAAVGEVAEAAR